MNEDKPFDPQADDMITAMYDTSHPYHELALVLVRAYRQSAEGKGKQRHATDGKRFTEQPMQSICELLGSADGMAYQVIKKVQEAQRLDTDAAINELLGAIVYAAGEIVFREHRQGKPITPEKMPASLYEGLLQAASLMRKQCIEPTVIRMGPKAYQQLQDELPALKKGLSNIDGIRIEIDTTAC